MSAAPQVLFHAQPFDPSTGSKVHKWYSTRPSVYHGGRDYQGVLTDDLKLRFGKDGDPEKVSGLDESGQGLTIKTNFSNRSDAQAAQALRWVGHEAEVHLLHEDGSTELVESGVIARATKTYNGLSLVLGKDQKLLERKLQQRQYLGNPWAFRLGNTKAPLGSPSDLDISGDLTIAGSIFWEISYGIGFLLGWLGGTATPWQLRVNASGNLILAWSGEGDVTSALQLVPGRWYDIAIIRDVSQQQVAFHALDVTTSTWAASVKSFTTNPVANSGATAQLNGSSHRVGALLSNWQVWSSALSETAAKGRARRVLNLTERRSSDLAAYWLFGDGLGATISDRSEAGLHMTFSGASGINWWWAESLRGEPDLAGQEVIQPWGWVRGLEAPAIHGFTQLYQVSSERGLLDRFMEGGSPHDIEDYFTSVLDFMLSAAPASGMNVLNSDFGIFVRLSAPPTLPVTTDVVADQMLLVPSEQISITSMTGVIDDVRCPVDDPERDIGYEPIDTATTYDVRFGFDTPKPGFLCEEDLCYTYDLQGEQRLRFRVVIPPTAIHPLRPVLTVTIYDGASQMSYSNGHTGVYTLDADAEGTTIPAELTFDALQLTDGTGASFEVKFSVAGSSGMPAVKLVAVEWLPRIDAKQQGGLDPTSIARRMLQGAPAVIPNEASTLAALGDLRTSDSYPQQNDTPMAVGLMTPNASIKTALSNLIKGSQLQGWISNCETHFWPIQGVPAGGSPAKNLRTDLLKDSGAEPPAWRLVLEYGHQQKALKPNEIAFASVDSAPPEFQEVERQAPEILGEHPLARDLRIKTGVSETLHAEQLADRLFAVMSKSSQQLEWSGEIDPTAAQPSRMGTFELTEPFEEFDATRFLITAVERSGTTWKLKLWRESDE